MGVERMLLKGLKILDFSTLLPGPFATLILSDLGAEVLHIKRPRSLDFASSDYLGRGKQTMELNLKEADSIEWIKEKITDYDILLEQFRPGVMERLGLGYEELKKINPRLIYCSLTGYGQTGPYKNRAGHDINYVGMTGLSSYSGTKEGGPAIQSTQIADLAGGSLYAVIGILSAVIYRNRTNEGQHIDISMTDGTFTLNALFASEYLLNGKELLPEELYLNGGSFYGYYQTKDGRYFSVGSLEPQFRKELCEAIGRPEIFQLSMSMDEGDMEQFKQILKEFFLEKTFDECKEIFLKNDACVEPVLTFAEACEHPQLKERNMVVEVNQPDGRIQKQIGCAIKTSLFQPKYDWKGEK
jgi:alpha-methylacyl-CoA racemase